MAYRSEQLQESMAQEDSGDMELLSWESPVPFVAAPQLGTEAVPLVATPQLGTEIVPLVTIPQVVITPQLGTELSGLFTPPFIPVCFGCGLISLFGLSKLGMHKHIVHRHNYFGYALMEALAVAAVSAAHALAADSTEVNNRIISPRRNHPIQFDGNYGNCVS